MLNQRNRVSFQNKKPRWFDRVRLSLSAGTVGLARFTRHAGLNLPKLALTSQQFLPLISDLTLHLKFDVAELVLFTPELLFLQAD